MRHRDRFTISTSGLNVPKSNSKSTEYLNKGYKIIMEQDGMYAVKDNDKIKIQDKT